MAKASSIWAKTASASPVWAWRKSCRKLSYVTGSKNAKSCQFTFLPSRTLITCLFKVMGHSSF
uniref:Uncharacterized protein n=1 Tax=Anguilla anguilla TaxID=7936 RepID=A0A0E9R7Z6_ANGAN